MKRIFIQELKVGDYIKVIGTAGRWKDNYWIGRVLNADAFVPDIVVYESNDEDINHTRIGIISSDKLYLLNNDEAMVLSL